ncbi:serine hydrolase [Bacteroidota bacterium]
MIVKIISFIICFSLLLSKTTPCQTESVEENSLPEQELLRVSEPVESIITDLKEFIPEYIRNENIPGVGIALIYEGKIVWTEGFGVTNTITGEPVTSNTLFEVASCSKVVTAYMALRLVDEDKISIDQSLHSYLTEDWMPPSTYRDSIKLRHVTSHSSGLSKTTEEIMFEPGTAYYYSANGFNLLEEVMEEVSGESFEELAQKLVFKPIGMKNSSFIKLDNLTSYTANGHIHALAPLIIFGILYTVLFFIVLLIGLIIKRVRTKSWKIKRSHIFIVLVITFVILSSALFILLNLVSLLEFAWLLVISGLISLALFLILFYIGRVFILQRFSKRKTLHRILSVAWSLILITGIVYISANIVNLPVPSWTDYDASPAGTLRTSAQELAMFMIELSDPQFLSTETVDYLRTPQIKLSDNLSWGMGPGILHSEQGYALWQWGQHVDFQTIMIIYPEYKFGVVVCTNNDLLNPDVALEIAHRALGGLEEPLRMAIHLQYDYKEQ